METLTKTSQANASVKAEVTKTKENSLSEFIKNAESNRFGITPIILLIMSCMGGFAAASGILDSWIKLAAVAFPATLSLAMILAVAPMRVIFITTAIAVVLDILVLIF